MKTLEIMKKIQETANKNANRAKSQKTRRVTEDIKCFRQGDLYVFRVDDNHQVGEEIKRNQLADGVSLGARHILNGEFTVYKGIQSPSFVQDLHSRVGLGYAFDVKETTVLVHPEHDNYVFDCNGRFQVMHQVDLRTLRRAAD